MDPEQTSERPLQGSLQWLAERRTGIGGSEISALYLRPDGTCAHPWMSQTEMWGRKTGRLPDNQPTPWEAPHLYVGRVLEQPVREMYGTFSGRTVSDGVTLMRDRVAPTLLASTDGEQLCPSRPDEPAVYEGKVTTVFRRKDWIVREEHPDTGDVTIRELVPLHYRCQTQHYMACTGLTWSSVVAFMQADQAPIHWRDIDRHDAFIDDMRERAARWWRDHVEADVPPPIDDSEATEAALRLIHREAEEVVVQLPAAFAAALDRLEAIGDLASMLKRERQRLRNMVFAALGPATLAVIAADGRGWSLRGTSGRSLRALTASGIDRARRGAMSRPVYVPPEVGRQLDELYSLSARAFATGQSLSAKAIHLAHLAVLAAKSEME
jgi:predicted phage-related endonuclease